MMYYPEPKFYWLRDERGEKKGEAVLPHPNLFLLQQLIKTSKPSISLFHQLLTPYVPLYCFDDLIINHYMENVGVLFNKSEGTFGHYSTGYYAFCGITGWDFLYIVTCLDDQEEELTNNNYIKHEIVVTLPNGDYKGEYFYTYFHNRCKTYITVLSENTYDFIKNNYENNK